MTRPILCRTSLAAILATLHLCFGLAAQGQQDDPGKRAVVQLKVDGQLITGSRFQQTGTGFFVAPPGYILTAAHVVQHPHKPYKPGHSPTIQVISLGEDGKTATLEQTAVIVDIDHHIDLALLRINEVDHASLPIGDSLKTKPGDPVRAILYGTSRTSGPYVSHGTVEEPFDSRHKGLIDLDLDNVEVTDSGSPVLDDSGRVIGLIVEGWDEVPESTEVFAVPVNRASPLLSMAGVHYPVTLQEWLRVDRELAAEGKSLDHRVAQTEYVIKRLKSSWDWHYEIRRAEGSRKRTLVILARKRLPSGFWPEEVVANVRPFVSIKQSDGEKSADVELEQISQSEVFEPEADVKTVFLEIQKLDDRLARRSEAYEAAHGVEVLKTTRLRIDIKTTDIDWQIREETPVWIDCLKGVCQ